MRVFQWCQEYQTLGTGWGFAACVMQTSCLCLVLQHRAYVYTFRHSGLHQWVAILYLPQYGTLNLSNKI